MGKLYLFYTDDYSKERVPRDLVMSIFLDSGRCLKKYLRTSCQVTVDVEFKVLDTVLKHYNIQISQ